MKKVVLAAGFAAVFAAGGLGACGGSTAGTGTSSDGGASSGTTGSGDSGAPSTTHVDGSAPSTSTDSGATTTAHPDSAAPVSFTGPSCQNGSVLGQPAACTTCIQTQCASVYSCETTSCSDAISCYCQCAANDDTCHSGCASTETSACQACGLGAIGCVTGPCAAACLGEVTDSGANNGALDGGAFAFDAATILPTGSCAALQTCCNTLGAQQTECSDLVAAAADGQTACSQALAGFQEAGVCR